jgi:Lon protease-like protein
MRGFELPIFPLPLVLFPGAPQLLHIFEPRYRQMLADCQAADRGFGISYVRAGPADPAPATGEVGCAVHVQAVRPLADGRSNLLAVGTARYLLLRFLRTDRLYRMAFVEPFEDDPPSEDGVHVLAGEVRSLFGDLVRDLGRIDAGAATPPPLSADPLALSFQVAAALDLDPGIKQRLLSLRATGRRLRFLRSALRRLRVDVERRARAQERARRNGKPISGVTLGQ